MGCILKMRAAVLALVLSSASAEDVGFEVLFETSNSSFANVCAPLPDDPRLAALVGGTFLQPGVGQYSLNGIEFQSALDAFGRITALHIEDGEICASGKMLTSKFYETSIASGTVAKGLFFADTVPPTRPCPLLKPMCNMAWGAARQRRPLSRARVSRTFPPRGRRQTTTSSSTRSPSTRARRSTR